MNEIGFSAQPQVLDAKIKEIEAFIGGEMALMSRFKEMLAEELRDVDDLQKNLAKIEERLEQLKIAQSHFKEMFKTLHIEMGSSSIDINKCTVLIDTVNNLVNVIIRIIPHLNNEAERIIQKDTHLIYAQNSAQQPLMEILEKCSLRARNIKADLDMITHSVQPIPKILDDYEFKIKKIRDERSLRALGQLPVVGFQK